MSELPPQPPLNLAEFGAPGPLVVLQAVRVKIQNYLGDSAMPARFADCSSGVFFLECSSVCFLDYSWYNDLGHFHLLCFSDAGYLLHF